MKKLAAVVLTCGLGLSATTFAFAGTFAGKDDSAKKMTGWVVDEKCGTKVANEHGAACAKRCVEAGQPVVFVEDKDQTVLKVSNQDSLKSHAGEHVSVSGSVENGTLKVDKVEKAAEAK